MPYRQEAAFYVGSTNGICMPNNDFNNWLVKKKSIKMWAVVFSLVLALEIILISSWELSIHSLLYAISIPSTNRKQCYYFLKNSCFFKDGSWYLKGEKLQMKPWNCKTHSYKCVHSCLRNTDMLINGTTWFRICLLAARHWCI